MKNNTRIKKGRIIGRMSFILLSMILSTLTLQAQKIAGRVVDESSEPLPGVNVIDKNGKTGTITDANGDFQLNISPQSVLVFKFIGYQTQEIAVKDKQVINVKLKEESKELDEVVVVGYGTMKKSDLSGSLSSVKLTNVNEGAGSSIDQFMQGRVAGVNITMNNGAPGATSNMLIRGGSSISGSNQPLYIIDGFPVEMADGGGSESSSRSTSLNPLATINPNSIESIEILKDASATAIYGSRGANGVVLIKTKEGKKGSKVQYSVRMDMSQLAKKIPMLSTRTFMDYQNEAQYNATGSYLYKPEQLDSLSALNPNTDWQDLIYRNSFSQDHQISVSGADDKTNYAITGNYMTMKGIILNSTFDRYSMGGNFNRTVNSILKVGLNVNYTNLNSQMAKQSYRGGEPGGSVVLGALFFRPLLNALTTDGSLETTVVNNPLYVAENVKDNINNISIRSQAYAEFTLSRFLKFKSTFGISDNYMIRESFEGIGTYAGAQAKGYAQRNDNRYYSLNSEQLLSYYRDFNKNNRLNAVVGFTYQNSKVQNMAVGSKGFDNESLGYYNFQIGSAQDKTLTQTYSSMLASFLTRINYTLYNKYIFTFSGRADGSSKLAQKWNFFPSGAFAWRVNEEPFMKDLKNEISNLKLRFSYGLTGNQSVAAMQTLTGLSNNYYPVGGVLTTGIKSGNVGNPDLKWETTAQYNGGVDLGIFNNRIRLTADLFYKKTSDLLINLNLAPTTGFSNYWTNAGEIENKGFEVEVATDIILQKGFTWTVVGNISAYANKVLSLGNDITAVYGQNWNNTGAYALNQPINVAKVGYPIGAFIGYKTDGIYQNQAQIDNYVFTKPDGTTTKIDPTAKPGFYKMVDLNNDGKIDSNDRTILGDAIPDFIFGLSSNLTYKNFDFNFTWQGSIGNQLVNLNRYVMDGLTVDTWTNISQAAWDNRWHGEGTSNDYQLPYKGSVMFRQQILDKLVEDASYIRLKNLTISYRVPIKKSLLSVLKVFVSGTNLLTFTKYSGYDPEANASTKGLETGVDFGVFPQPRTYSFGANIEF